MAGQSMIMGLAFGTSYQYGKRKISSLTNEQFNQLDAEKLGKQLITDYNAIIPSLAEAVKSSSDFQTVVIRELIDVAKNLPGDFWTGLWGTSDAGGSRQTDTSASNVFYGGSIGIPGGLLKGVEPATGEDFTDFIDKLAKEYMEATGLADFENAKKTIIDKINADKAAQAKIIADIDASKLAAAKLAEQQKIDTATKLAGEKAFLTQPQKLAQVKANHKILLQNLASAKAYLQLKQLERKRLKTYYDSRGLLGSPRVGMSGAAMTNAKLSMRKMNNIVSGANTKVVNIQRILRNPPYKYL